VNASLLHLQSVTSNELYGYMTLAKEWRDGVISIIMRGMSKCYKELGYHQYQTIKWVVLDGDIDAVWIESMNTVSAADDGARPRCTSSCLHLFLILSSSGDGR
jgi:hypothetical protein